MGRITTWACMLGLALGAGTTATAAEPVGFIAAVEGEVLVSPDDALSWEAARQDAAVSIGDRIKTAEGASARILLVDDTTLHVAEDTELRIESFHVGAAATRERSIVRQTRGRLRTVVGDAFGGSTRLEVHTPTAVVGVKGTDFETRDVSLPGQPRWQCCLHAGGIDVSNGFGSVSPRPGHCVHVGADRAPGPEFPSPLEPFRGPDQAGVPTDDFAQRVASHGPWPGLPDVPDPDDLRVIDVELPTQAPASVPTVIVIGPALVAGP